MASSYPYSITLIRRSQQILFDINVKSSCSKIPRYYLFKLRKTRIIVWQNNVLSLSPTFFNCVEFSRWTNRKIFYSHVIFIPLQIPLHCFRSMLWWRSIQEYNKFFKSLSYSFKVSNKGKTVKPIILSEQLFIPSLDNTPTKSMVLLWEPVTVTTGLLYLAIHFLFIHKSCTNIDSSCTRICHPVLRLVRISCTLF